MSENSLFPLSLPDWMLEPFRSSALPPPRFNGVPCEHYRQVKKYQRELEAGGVVVPREDRFEGKSSTDVIAWAKTLPDEAKVVFDDWNGIFAEWEEFVHLTEEEVSLRKVFIEENPIPEGEPDPQYLRWKRAIPFEAPALQLVEGQVPTWPSLVVEEGK